MDLNGKFVLQTEAQAGEAMPVVAFLAEKTGFSKTKIKEAMVKGALWRRRGKGKILRLRRADTLLRPGDRLEFYHDARLLDITPPPATLVLDANEYSAWCKPAGLLAQGTKWSDHASLLRLVELHFIPRRQVYLVHRLDRETAGLMLIAHTQKIAGALGDLFATGKIRKEYRAEVIGNLMTYGPEGTIDAPLDGRNAQSAYTAVSYDPVKNTTVVAVIIATGRHHQIRRHFANLGFPVMGDPLYGKGNKNREGLQLLAVSLAFVCPVSGKPVTLHL